MFTHSSGYARDAEPTSRLLRVLNSIRSWSLVKASLEYWKLNVENGVSGSSKMSKSAKSFSFSVSRGTPERESNQLINNTLGSFLLIVITESFQKLLETISPSFFGFKRENLLNNIHKQTAEACGLLRVCW